MRGSLGSLLSRASPKGLSTSRLVHSPGHWYHQPWAKALTESQRKEPQEGGVERLQSLSANVLNKDVKRKEMWTHTFANLPLSPYASKQRWFPPPPNKIIPPPLCWPMALPIAAPGQKKSRLWICLLIFEDVSLTRFSFFSGLELNIRHRAGEGIKNID